MLSAFVRFDDLARETVLVFLSYSAAAFASAEHKPLPKMAEVVAGYCCNDDSGAFALAHRGNVVCS